MTYVRICEEGLLAVGRSPSRVEEQCSGNRGSLSRFILHDGMSFLSTSSSIVHRGSFKFQSIIPEMELGRREELRLLVTLLKENVGLAVVIYSGVKYEQILLQKKT